MRRKALKHGSKQTAPLSLFNEERATKVWWPLFYAALKELEGKVAGEESLAVMKKALENVKPSIEVRSRRVGGATYQVPVDVRPTRRLALAMRWLVEYSRARGEKSFEKRLAGELLDAYNNRGNSIKKKEDVHKMAESNKAFAHYNW